MAGAAALAVQAGAVRAALVGGEGGAPAAVHARQDRRRQQGARTACAAGRAGRRLVIVGHSRAGLEGAAGGAEEVIAGHGEPFAE